jgi:hypothetical protein
MSLRKIILAALCVLLIVSLVAEATGAGPLLLRRRGRAPSGTLSVATVDTSTHFIQASTAEVLSVPRLQMVLSSDSGYINFCRHSTWPNSIFTGTGLPSLTTGWDDTAAAPNASQSDHAQLTIFGDTIYFAGDAGGTLQMGSFDVTTPGAITAIASGSYDIGTRFCYRGGIGRLPGSDSLILWSRGHDPDTEDSADVSFVVSTDACDTWGTHGPIADLESYSVVRIGGLVFNNTVWVFAYVRAGATDTVFSYSFDRTTASWDYEGYPVAGPMERNYAMSDHGDYVVGACGTRWARGDEWVYWGIRHKDSSAAGWYRDSIPISDTNNTASNELQHIGLCDVQGVLWLMYIATGDWGVGGTPTDDSLYLAARWFDDADSTWSSEIRLTAGGQRDVEAFTPHQSTPSAWGYQFFILYVCYDADDSRDEWNIKQITFTVN